MKKASKYDNMFDKMREVLIEYATAKDEQGRWLHKTPEIMRKFGFGDDPKVIDGFNRWLNRQGIYRCPKPKRSELIPETLFPAEEIPTKAEEPAKTEVENKPPTAEQRLEWIALHNYTAFVQTMAMIKADTEHFKICRFMSWRNKCVDPTVTATALCDDDDWFMAAINCTRDGDMGELGPDGVYERIWVGDSLWPEEKARPSTIKEVARFRDHIGLADYWVDKTLQFFNVFYLPEGPVAVYRKLKAE